MTKLKEMFNVNFSGMLIDLSIENFDAYKFIIVSTNEKENYTNWDDMFRLWTTPTFTGIKLDYDEVIKYLVKETQNLLPLWVNISYKKGLPIVLEISQRFRKERDINARNPNNKFAPFELKNNKDICQILESERLEAIRILTFNRISDNRIKNLIGSEISIEEIEQSISKILMNYKFYPPKPNHQKPGDSNYSQIVINKDFKNSTYSICDAEKLEKEIQSKLNMFDAIKYYLNHQIEDEFCGIKVSTN